MATKRIAEGNRPINSCRKARKNNSSQMPANKLTKNANQKGEDKTFIAGISTSLTSLKIGRDDKSPITVAEIMPIKIPIMKSVVCTWKRKSRSEETKAKRRVSPKTPIETKESIISSRSL